MRARSGFTLVELAVVVVIIGVLAAFAVPRFMASVERSKAAEEFNYLSSVQAAVGVGMPLDGAPPPRIRTGGITASGSCLR